MQRKTVKFAVESDEVSKLSISTKAGSPLESREKSGPEARKSSVSQQVGAPRQVKAVGQAKAARAPKHALAVGHAKSAGHTKAHKQAKAPGQSKAVGQSRAPKQVALIAGMWKKDRFAFGGALLKNSHAKAKRHFVAKLPLHVVLRSSKAKGAMSFMNHNKSITRILNEQCARNHVLLRSGANAGNHLHLLIEAPSRDHLSAFLKAIAGRIAMALTQSKKTEPMNVKGFWDARPFSRIVSRGRDLLSVARYITLNSTELAASASSAWHNSVNTARSTHTQNAHAETRFNTRAMFLKIQDYLDRGLLPRSSRLLAIGFI